MSVPASGSVGRFGAYRKRPPTARQRRIEGLTTRRCILLMAISHLMYLCPQMGGNLLRGRGRADG